MTHIQTNRPGATASVGSALLSSSSSALPGSGQLQPALAAAACARLQFALPLPAAPAAHGLCFSQPEVLSIDWSGLLHNMQNELQPLNSRQHDSFAR